VLPYRSGDPVPPGYQLESTALSGLITGGLITLIAGYGAAVAVGTANDFEEGTGWLAVPVIGPWGAMGARKLTCDADEFQRTQCTEAAVDELTMFAFLAVDGLIQGAGAALILGGAIGRQRQLVRADLTTTAAAVPTVVPRFGLGRGAARFELHGVF
jgi:hypothetical protein